MSFPTLQTLADQLALCMGADRRRLKRRLDGLRRAARAATATEGAAPSDGHKRLARAIEASVQERADRAAAIPVPTLNADLPILQHREAIAEAIDAHPVLILCGETGSGKTTQLPQICLALGRGVEGLIGHTQPRRIAARSVATRIAEELGTPLGEAVGFQVRFQDRTSDSTYVKVMTDGILLAEIQHDPFLRKYDTLIIDEAHERSLNIDFLLGYLKALLEQRDDLRVIITSATIDPDRFSEHFDGAPIIEVSGRTYPVEIRYRAPQPTPGEDIDWPAEIHRAWKECVREGDGDGLVFLPGERDIRDAADYIRKREPGLDVLPLYARLSPQKQMAVFKAHGGRRLVLATNVAETSITVPGIRYVIDTGLARISRYSGRWKVQRLPIEPISQASALQRSGRCGRVRDGICIRLYEERDFERREMFTPPQILRTHLAGVILQMKAIGLGDVEAFPFVEPPRFGMLRDGYQQLYELGAVDAEGELTDVGRKLSRLPVDPRFGRILLEGEARDCLPEIMILVAALTVRDPRERPAESREDADAAHRSFSDPRSDYLTLLKLWALWEQQRADLGSSALRRWCIANHLNHLRLREWSDLLRQLRDVAKDAGLTSGTRRAPPDAIHRSLLAGLLAGVGHRDGRWAYKGTHGTTFWLWPGSVLAQTPPKWIVAAERIETARLHGRMVTPIDPKWIEPLAQHLVRRHYSDPHWHEGRGFVQAYERVTLYDLEIVSRRKVDYGRIHAPHARSIFLRHGLVEGRLRIKAPFIRHNQELIEHFEELATRARAASFLVAPEDRYAFYDERTPAEVLSTATLKAWLKKASKEERASLFMRDEDLLLDPSKLPPEHLYPNKLSIRGVTFPLRYRFEPGDVADGVSVRIPLEALEGLDMAPLQWLVPGLLPARIEAVLRALPKASRVPLIPLPETAEELAAALYGNAGDFTEQLVAALKARGRREVHRGMVHLDRIPAGLCMNVQVADGQGRLIDQDRDLHTLRRRLLGDRVQAAPQAKALSSAKLKAFPEEPLPTEVPVSRGGHTVTGWPALADHGDHVVQVIEASPARAARTHAGGVRRLLALALRRELRGPLRAALQSGTLAMIYGTLGLKQPLETALEARIAEQAAYKDGHPPEGGGPRDAAAFDALAASARPRCHAAAARVCKAATTILTRYHEVARKLMLEPPPSYAPSIKDMIGQLGLLLSEGWLTEIPTLWFERIPRYLDAIDHRLRKLGAGGLKRDLTAMKAIDPHWARYAKRAAALKAEGRVVPALERYRWMIEELRISRFAQDLGTHEVVSEKRLTKLWDEARFE